MKATPTSCFLLLIALLLSLGPAKSLRAQPANPETKRRSSTETRKVAFKDRGFTAVSSAASGSSLREIVDSRYKKRYQEWKDEFLSTEIGRTQWEMFSKNPHLVLTVTIAEGNVHGAGTGKYKWNESGELIAATIALGNRIDEGYPISVYYPVMNALEPFEASRLINGNVLAATKIAHEFGHVIKIAGTPEALYHLQVQLVPAYNKIFLSNGHNVNDPRLVELARQMGGNPVELWEDREYWGEANAMLYLRDRVAKEKFHCRLFGKIKQAVEEYAKNYEDRFTEIAKSQGVTYSCSWK